MPGRSLGPRKFEGALGRVGSEMFWAVKTLVASHDTPIDQAKAWKKVWAKESGPRVWAKAWAKGSGPRLGPRGLGQGLGQGFSVIFTVIFQDFHSDFS